MSQDNPHRITVYAQTDVGMVRAGNEDTFLVLKLDTSETWTPVTVEGDPPDHFSSFAQGDAGTILAVSDGMGGALAGEVASRMAVEGVREHMLHFLQNPTFSAFPFHERLRLAVEQANTHINNESMGNADYAGMGATFTAAGVCDGVLTLAQIGDSRCYLMRKNRIALVTHDQSLVWQLVEAGHITEEEAETHQYKNVILQALGAQPRVNVVVDRIPINDGDTILLCSDGLSGRVKADEMLDIVTKTSSLRDACEQLIQLANDRGGEDNITVVVARFENGGLPPPGELLSERVERDPNLPYDLDDDVLLDIEPTINPDQMERARATNRLSSEAPSETALLDPTQVPSTGGSSEITAEVAERIAHMNDQAGAPVPTSVGLPALTPEIIAQHAKMMAEADKPKRPDEPAASAPDTPKKETGGGLKGPLIAIAIVAVLAAVAWFAYQQQRKASAEHARVVSEATALNDRALQAQRKLGSLAPDIEKMTPGPQHDEAVKLREAALHDLDQVRPLLEPALAKPESVTEARQLCEHVDSNISRIEQLLLTGNGPQPADQTASTTSSPS